MTENNGDLLISVFDPSSADQIERLRHFCDRCAELGIENNSSLEKMKLHLFSQANEARLWIVTDRSTGALVGTAGAHRLPEVSKTCFRLLFRGAMLPEYRSRGFRGLSKKHLNSFLFSQVAPLQLRWAQSVGGDLFVVTTNVSPAGKGLSNTNRVFEILEKQKLVECIQREVTLFSTLQNIWKVGPHSFTGGA